MQWIIIVFVVAFIVWKMMPAKGVQSISTEEVKKIRKDKTKQFIDVRTPGEYQSNHVKEFENIPLNTLKGQLNRLDSTQATFVICQSGMRSRQASKILKKAGFSTVVNITGGMNAWKN